uniref:Kinesin 7-IIa protein n=1 Tax=Marsilea vestita TaxID=59764 RepID=A0A142KWA2_MARVE|nr:kinesin 7-IIa protein [Marsilea vestita]
MSEDSSDSTAFSSPAEPEVTSGDSPDPSGGSPLGMGGSGDSDSEDSWCDRIGSSNEEKINVSVRIRPLNSKEISNNDYPVWDCTDLKTITCLYTRPDRNYPQSYVFDRVFRQENGTREVYEKGAKEVTLSALSGKNATIFAYGQTCSGKTYTMNGITEYAADDIFNYIKQHDDHVFLIKFSALEIYNEVATDLLNPGSGPLRIMDDPERGTVIEKLVEEIVKDKDHLLSLLSICEDHRQVGETVMNDISSRSHQIIRLTIERSSRVVCDERPGKSLVAALNFVDLAGSERASLTHSEGTTLKEGCYINRSLLSLSTVIRKLSDPNRPRSTHIPYRESKLTRILSNALGGNARTAIICTMSLSNRHFEQTRNTLFFASCAKEVTTRAQVNVVISDKDLIKQLKKEVALLEAQLRRSSVSSQNSVDSMLMEKDLQIRKMKDELDKAFRQRDSALSELDVCRKERDEFRRQSFGVIHTPSPTAAASDRHMFGRQSYDAQRKSSRWKEPTANELRQQPLEDIKSRFAEKQVTQASAVLLEEIYKLEHLQSELAKDANRALEVVQKEVECLCLTQTDMNQEAAQSVAKLQAEINEIYESRVTGAKGALSDEENRKFCSLKEDIQRIASEENLRTGDAETIQDMLQDMRIALGELAITSGQESSTQNGATHTNGEFIIDGFTPPEAQESIRSVYAYVTDMKERINKLQYQKQLLLHRVMDLESNGGTVGDAETMAITLPTSPEKWKSEFQTKQKQIFELWDICYVSIIHRSQFYLLFRGDPADAIYIEVELRRLTWLKDNQCVTNKSPVAFLRGEQLSSPASSLRALKRERESMVRYLNTRLSAAQREEVYKQWGIPLDTKQRKMKLANMIWTNWEDEQHIKMSAELVARLVTLWNRNGPVSKEMFQLSFTPPTNERSTFRLSNLFSFRAT